MGTAPMTTDEFLQYLAGHDCLRELEPTFTGLVTRRRCRQDSLPPGTVTVLRTDERAGAPVPSLEAAG
jgi:hypothetical protein